MRDHEREFEAAGARLAAVGLGDLRYAEAFRKESGIDFPLLVDRKRRAYELAGLQSASVLHLAYPTNVAAGARALAAGFRQRAFGEHPFQLGGSFVFAPGDVQLHAHVNETFSDDATPAALLAVVRRRA